MFGSSLKKIKEKLEAGKKSLEAELEKIAQKDENLPGDWDSKFPKFNGGSASQIQEEGADEVEEYATRLSIEYSLESRLKDVSAALEKIAKGKYGLCEKCGKKIEKERLEVYPEARTCNKCK